MHQLILLKITNKHSWKIIPNTWQGLCYMAQQACEVCQVLGQSSQMKKPTVNCSSYIVMFLRQWAVLSILIIMGLIHPSFHKKKTKTSSQGMAKIKSGEFSLWIFSNGYFALHLLSYKILRIQWICWLWHMETLGFIVRSQIKIYHKCYPQVCSEQHVQRYLMALGDLSISEFERTEYV